MSQLRLLITSSKSALQIVHIEHISGLSNEGLRTWLAEVGPTLQCLGITSVPLSRQPDAEEYAVDAVLPTSMNLCFLDLVGDLASVALLRYEHHGLGRYHSKSPIVFRDDMASEVEAQKAAKERSLEKIH